MKKKTLKEQVKEYKNKYLYALADFENYKKRVQKEREEFLKYSNERLILELIPIMDNFERALNTKKASKKDFYKGIELIYNQFKTVLEKEGLTTFESIGKTFDPNIHEAVSIIESKRYPEDTVAKEIEKGYILKGKIARPARVVVSKKDKG